jgi:hypothetical protein
MIDVERLSEFIAAMDGDSAEVTKTNLVAIEREIREGRAAKAMLAAAGAIDAVCVAIGAPEVRTTFFCTPGPDQ